MAVILNDSLKNGRYSFFSKVFNWPSVRTVSEYNSLGGNEEDGLMYEVLENISLDDSIPEDDWRRHISLKWDACHIADKVCYNL